MFKIANGLLTAAVIFFLTAGEIAGQSRKNVFTQKEMGSPFTLIIYGDSLPAAKAAAAAFAEVNRLNGIFSDYLDSSESNKLCRVSRPGIYEKVSPELFQMIARSVHLSRISNGAFDITVGPLVKVWRAARRENKFPDSAKLHLARQSVGYQYIHLDTAHQSVMFEKKGVQLDFGGIAKGYAAQAALDIIRKAGFSSAMVDAGGDMILGDPPPTRSKWVIGISVPEAYEGLMQHKAFLANKAVATSGDIYQYIEKGKQRYSHIIDPKTGYGVTFQRNVTVIADDGAMADGLASACSVLSIPEGLKLIENIEGAAILIAEKRDTGIYQISSPNFKDYYLAN